MKQLDHNLSKRVHGLQFGPLDYVLVGPGMIFGSYVMPLTVMGMSLWLGWRFGAICIMAALTTLAITGPMKHYFGRVRPEPIDSRRFKLRKLVNNPAVPSGDSAQAGAMVMLVVMLGPWPWSLAALPLAPLCMFSRVYFGAHWVGDTVAGVLIGALVGGVYGFWFGGWVV